MRTRSARRCAEPPGRWKFPRWRPGGESGSTEPPVQFLQSRHERPSVKSVIHSAWKTTVTLSYHCQSKTQRSFWKDSGRNWPWVGRCTEWPWASGGLYLLCKWNLEEENMQRLPSVMYREWETFTFFIFTNCFTQKNVPFIFALWSLCRFISAAVWKQIHNFSISFMPEMRRGCIKQIHTDHTTRTSKEMHIIFS